MLVKSSHFRVRMDREVNLGEDRLWNKPCRRIVLDVESDSPHAKGKLISLCQLLPWVRNSGCTSQKILSG